MRKRITAVTALAGSLLLAPLMLGPTQAAPDLKNAVSPLHSSTITLVGHGGGGGGGGGGHGGGGFSGGGGGHAAFSSGGGGRRPSVAVAAGVPPSAATWAPGAVAAFPAEASTVIPALPAGASTIGASSAIAEALIIVASSAITVRGITEVGITEVGITTRGITVISITVGSTASWLSMAGGGEEILGGGEINYDDSCWLWTRRGRVWVCQ